MSARNRGVGLGDTIFAVASPPGAAARGVLRISGPAAIEAAGALLNQMLPPQRATLECQLEVVGFKVPCLVLTMPAPRSYTGEDVVELHLPGSPLLLEDVQNRLRASLRDATPGEFTRRAYETGRLDLAEAEAVAALIHAAGETEHRHALSVLRGGLASRVDAARGALLDLLGLLEAGLDFDDGETGSVDRGAWLPGIDTVYGDVEALRGGLPDAAPGGELLLLGAANAGKSSLCNALAGSDRVLVSPQAGTTRDVLAVEVAPGVVLLDGPGDLAAPAGADRAALALRDSLLARAGAAVLVVDATAPWWPGALPLPLAAVVLSKCDLAVGQAPPPGLPVAPRFAVSATTGAGLERLAAFLARQSSGGPAARGSRVGDSLGTALVALRRARDVGRNGEPSELVAVDLGEALDALDAVHGRTTPEDVLDRIFAGFCLGK